MKRTISLLLLACLLALTPLALTSCGRGVPSNTVAIVVKDYGEITVELDPKAAPITVENFKKLVSEGFYDGCTFYRVVSDFVIQGGGKTTVSATRIKGEFALNGHDNPIEHVRGVISMARSDSYDSASSEFFIVTTTSDATSFSLDGQYAAFGYVVEGLDVVDKIASVRKLGQTPLEDIVISRMYFK